MTERLDAVREELCEVQSLAELKAIWCHWQCEYPDIAKDVACNLMLRSTLTRLRLFEEPVAEPEVVQESAVVESKPPVHRVRGSRKYVLLKTDVGWSTKPQVHALMQILAAHVEVGQEVDEDDIVRMMEANEEVLHTRQGGKRIWDYYKGDHNEGLRAHGNIERR